MYIHICKHIFTHTQIRNIYIKDQGVLHVKSLDSLESNVFLNHTYPTLQYLFYLLSPVLIYSTEFFFFFPSLYSSVGLGPTTCRRELIVLPTPPVPRSRSSDRRPPGYT